MTGDRFSEAVHPGVETFHNPPVRDEVRVAPIRRFPRHTDEWAGYTHARILRGCLADIARVKTGVFDRPFFRMSDARLQQRADPLAVVRVGSADNKRQRDAIDVDERVSLASIFFPDPKGSAPRIPAPAALLHWFPLRIAIPRRSLPAHRIPPIPCARSPQTTPPWPIAGNAYAGPTTPVPRTFLAQTHSR
jgi:hypothetical protein